MKSELFRKAVQGGGRIADTGFGSDDLFNMAARGMLIEAPAVKTKSGALVTPATLEMSSDGEFFRMTGVTGQHSLARRATNPERLAIHWAGFKAQASAKAAA